VTSDNSFVGVFEYMFDMSNDAHPLNLIFYLYNLVAIAVIEPALYRLLTLHVAKTM